MEKNKFGNISLTFFPFFPILVYIFPSNDKYLQNVCTKPITTCVLH